MKHEVLLVGSMTILHFSRRVAKGTLKLLLDRWLWGMAWLTNVASSSLFFVRARFSLLLLSLVLGDTVEDDVVLFLLHLQAASLSPCCMWTVKSDRPSPSLLTCAALPLPLPLHYAALPLPLPLHLRLGCSPLFCKVNSEDCLHCFATGNALDQSDLVK